MALGKKGSRNSTSSGGLMPSWGRSWEVGLSSWSLRHLPSASLWLPGAWVSAFSVAAIVCVRDYTFGSDVIWTWKLGCDEVNGADTKCYYVRPAYNLHCFYCAVSQRDNGVYYKAAATNFFFLCFTLTHDFTPFFLIFISNPKSDSHVMLKKQIKPLSGWILTTTKRKKKGKSSPQIYQMCYKMKEGGW